MLKDLIEALTIFQKYLGDKKYVTHSEHDVFYVVLEPSLVTEEDKKRLEELGFHVSEEDDYFYSFAYG